MSKIWKLTYKQPYGTRGNFWNKSQFFYDEAKMLKELQKLKVEHKKLIDDTTKELKKDTQEIQSKK